MLKYTLHTVLQMFACFLAIFMIKSHFSTDGLSKQNIEARKSPLPSCAACGSFFAVQQKPSRKLILKSAFIFYRVFKLGALGFCLFRGFWRGGGKVGRGGEARWKFQYINQIDSVK